MADVYSVLTGEKINRLYVGTNFYKLTNKTEKHHNFRYQDGLNIDTIPFNPTRQCSAGGLYFTEESKLSLWFDVANTYIRKVIIPNDAKVYIETNKFKADKIFLEPRGRLEDFGKWNDQLFCIQQIEKNIDAFPFVKYQTPEICLIFDKWNDPLFCIQQAKKNIDAFPFVKYQTPEICLMAVKRDAYALQYVKKQTPEICLGAVKKNGLALQFVKEQTPEICLGAVKKNGLAIQFVKEQTPELRMEAIINNEEALEYVK